MKLGHDRSTPRLPSGPAASSPPPRQGALVVIDSFESSDSHGYLVEGAARELGPDDPGIYYRVSQHEQVDGRPSMPHVRALARFQARLAAAPLEAGPAQKCFEEFVVEAAAGNLQLATSLLHRVEAEGFQQSVVNLSQGLDSLALLQLASYPIGPKSRLEPQQRALYRANLEKAVQAGPGDSTELDRRLLKNIHSLLQSSPAVETARQQWRAQVRSFESAHNSVVVAAGNSGQAMKGLARASFQLDGGEDQNLLSVEEVTTVGASTGPSLSAASSFGPEVDFLADGEHAGRFGTSFASPKVASLMRAAHLLQPELSSAEVEEWVKANLAEAGQVGGHNLAVVDSQRAERFVRRFGA